MHTYKHQIFLSETNLKLFKLSINLIKFLRKYAIFVLPKST